MLTPSQVKLLEELGFKETMKDTYSKHYGVVSEVWVVVREKINVVIYHALRSKKAQQDLAKLKEGGIE